MGTRASTPAPSVRPTERDRARLGDDGFVVLEGVFDGCDFGTVRRILGRATRHHRLLPGWARQELGDGVGDLPQINGLTRLFPALRRSDLVQRATALAGELLGEPAQLRFDFSITKRAGTTTEVPWHQDSAYHPDGESSRRLHFWIPLQDTSAQMGCMEYLPGSHRRGRMEHHRVREDNDYALSIDAPVDIDHVSCEVRRGSVIVHESLTWHRTGPNRSPQDRAMWALELEAASTGRRRLPTVRQLGRAAQVVRFRLRSAS